MSTRAEEIIRLQQREEEKDANFRSLWQDTADHMFPRESFITETLLPGVVKADRIYDSTGLQESENMTSGLLTNLVPAGQKFFSITVAEPELQDIDANKSYLARATETLHQQLFRSNFLLQLGETIRSLITFGTGNLFSEWRGILNFMDWDISRYQILENFQGVIDTNIVKFPKTAAQAFKEWGMTAGKSVLEAMETTKKQQDMFWFIHIVRPREKRNPRLKGQLNMPFESIYVNVKDKIEVREGGFPEFPYHIPRWTKTTGEVHGRGIGTRILSQVRKLQQMESDYIEVGNKFANPHREVNTSVFEGEYNTTPGAVNDVQDFPASHVDERNFGNYFVTKDALEMERQVVKDAFFHDAFAPLTDLTGDRRNMLEIQERIQEAFRKIGSPIGRVQTELFTPLIERCYLLLVRNEVIAKPPPQLEGGTIKITYQGPLALALEDSEIRASRQWVGVLGEISQIPGLEGVVDNVQPDNTARRMGRVLGVNEDDIASEEEVALKREVRQKELEAQRALEMAQLAASAYGQTTKKPEEGSGAEQMQEALS
jgi:hypothetical protein